MHNTILASKKKIKKKIKFYRDRFVVSTHQHNTSGSLTTPWVTKYYLRPRHDEVLNGHNNRPPTQQRQIHPSDQGARLLLCQRSGRLLGAGTAQHPQHEHLQNKSPGPRGQTDSGQGVRPQASRTASATEKQTDHQGQLAPRHPTGSARETQTESESKPGSKTPTSRVERQAPDQRGNRQLVDTDPSPGL